MRRSSPHPSLSIVPIRHATPEDLPLIRELEQQCATAAHWGEREYTALFTADAPKRMALVVTGDEVGPAIHGFVIARCTLDEWEIENVVVSPELRRRGIASSLVGEILREARRAGAASVLLEVRESNSAARQLYERLGFSGAGRRPGYYRDPVEDALVLRISIAVP